MRRALPPIAFLLTACGSSPPPVEPPVVPVPTAILTLQDHYEVERAFLGRVRPRQSTALGFEREGRVARIDFDEGDAIEAGAVVATLDVARLKAERSRLRASLQQLDAKVDLAERTARRVATLADQKFASEQRRDETALGLKADRARRREVAASLDQIEVELDKSVVRAPFPGTVVRRFVDSGAVVGGGQPVIELQGRRIAEAEIGVPIGRAQELELGERYSLRWRGLDVEAELSSIVEQVRPGARTVTALFRLPSDRSWIREEQIELRVRERIEAEGFWVPLTALSQGPRGSWVIYVVGEGVIVPEAAEILHATSSRAFVRGTLEEGQAMVVDGTHRVVPGQRVEGVEAVAGVEASSR
jgi:membrane fusion protein, multidrug efflux system